MSRYLLDSNICSAWLKNNKRVVDRIVSTGENQIYLCTPVKAELWYGACQSQRVTENQASLMMLFNGFNSVTFEDKAALHFGFIRAHLSRLGTPIGPYDLQIAAIAVANDLTLVTHNTREFIRVPELMLEDWLT